MTSPDAALQGRELSCGYPGRLVLERVSFRLAPGSITALLGPNGSGKSTLLRTLSKTLPKLGGDVLVQGESIGRLGFRELARQVAFVPQEEEFVYGFSVAQVVTMGRLPRSGGFFDTAEDHEAAESAMAAADCLHLASRPMTEISGGEKQRVLIARALAQGARILLMDEPTSHLDVGHQVSIAALLRGLAADGYAILAAVHDLNLAGAFAEDGILLSERGIGMHGPILDVLGSKLIEQVYSVGFRRLTPEDGQIFLIPQG